MRRHVQRMLALAVAAIAVAAVVGTGLVLTGQIAIVATNGVSMNPVYYQGDLVVVQRSGSYRVGDIVAYRQSRSHLVVLHRIIAGDPAGFVFKGDNNASTDPTRPTQDQLVGRAMLHIPHGGTWLHRLTAPPLLGMYALLALLGGRHAAGTVRRRRRKDARTMSPRHHAPLSRRLSVLPPALRPIAIGTVAIALAGVALSTFAWTRPTEQAARTETRRTSNTVFSYAAHVARSAAYDGTTITAPQPVFRQLANDVDVTYRYTGRPGRLSLSAELSTASGWKTRVPLGETVVGSTYRGAAQLDLRALERRAAEAAKAIGLPMGPVSVAVVAAVRFDDGGSFEPRLDLVLEPQVMRLRGDLNVSSAAAVTRARPEPTHLSLLGRSVDTAVARTVGGAAMALAVLIALLLAVLASLHGPTGRADRIRARYRDLILPVLPMTFGPGQRVVEVPDVASLARLAERYGLLIMHWSEGDVHTFVVQDEGTTFRCRLGLRAVRLAAAA